MATAASFHPEALKLDGAVAAAPFFEPFKLPATNQRDLGAPHAPGTVVPLALRPTDPLTIEDAVATVQRLQKDGTLTHLLSQHGAIVFRGLPIQSAEEFSAVAHAFNYSPHEIIGIVVDRPALAPNVAPANESPPHVLVYNHNESPQVPHAPEYVMFYAHKAAREGGETPISSSAELFARVEAEIPEFIEQLVAHGVLSKVTYKPAAQYDGGSTLRQAFGKDIVEGDDQATQRRKIEAQIARYGRGENTTWEWSDDGTLVLSHRLPSVRTHPHTGVPVLFTGLAAYYRNAERNGSRVGVTKQLYGNGVPIPEEYLAKLAEITDDIRVLHKWQQGDLLVLDNVLAQHGREPWVGEQKDRIVMASLWDGVVPGAYGEQEWAKSVQALDG